MIVNYQCFNTPIYSAVIYCLIISFYIFLYLYLHMVLYLAGCCPVGRGGAFCLVSVQCQAQWSLQFVTEGSEEKIV